MRSGGGGEREDVENCLFATSDTGRKESFFFFNGLRSRRRSPILERNRNKILLIKRILY
jgi:hypothetical protein